MRVLGAAQHAALRGGQRRQPRGDVVALAADLRALLLDGVELAQLRAAAARRAGRPARRARPGLRAARRAGRARPQPARPATAVRSGPAVAPRRRSSSSGRPGAGRVGSWVMARSSSSRTVMRCAARASTSVRSRGVKAAAAARAGARLPPRPDRCRRPRTTTATRGLIATATTTFRGAPGVEAEVAGLSRRSICSPSRPPGSSRESVPGGPRVQPVTEGGPTTVTRAEAMLFLSVRSRVDVPTTARLTNLVAWVWTRVRTVMVTLAPGLSVPSGQTASRPLCWQPPTVVMNRHHGRRSPWLVGEHHALCGVRSAVLDGDPEADHLPAGHDAGRGHLA